MPRGFVSHLDLNVSDPVASSDFYGIVLGALGFRRHPIDDAGRTWWALAYDDHTMFGIEIRPPREPAPRDRHERYAPGIDHLALQADDRADVDLVARRLVDEGYPVVDPPAEYDYTPGYYATAFDDPDGIRIEVVHEPTRDTVATAVTVTHLEMGDRPSVDRSGDELVVSLVPEPRPALNQFLYRAVGADWAWHTRFDWPLDRWAEKLGEPGTETWLASVDGIPAGYFELLHGGDDCEILYFGLLPEATGRGLGPQLLRAAIDEAWRRPSTVRVHLTTCTHDHPRALPNYLAGGFEIARTEDIVDHVPRRHLPVRGGPG